MLKNWEKQTHELTDEEKLKIVPILVSGFKKCVGKTFAYTNYKIKMSLYNNHGIKTSEPRIRKMIQYIRTHDLVDCIVASGKGYYISHNREEIESYIDSLQKRCNSIEETLGAVKRQFRRRFIDNNDPQKLF